MNSISADDKNMALVAHLAPIIGWFIGLGQIIVPIIIMMSTKSEYVKAQARESLNAQISFSIVALIGVILIVVFVGIPLLLALGVFAI